MYKSERDDDFWNASAWGNFDGYDEADEYEVYYSSLSGAYDNQLGIALLPVAGSVIGGISKIFGGSKDDGRLKSNAEAYNLAIGANPPYKDQPSALEFLRVMSTSWATQKAKDDAAAKYRQAVSVINARKASTATPKPATTSAPKSAPVIAGMSVPPLLIAGIAAAGIVMLARRK